MNFLNPLALLGLAATVVPLAIHLLHLGRTRPVPFSNLKFLRALHQTRMRSLRLRQWLVLLLRTLAVAFIVLAFSRPAYRAQGSGIFGTGVPTAAVILLDRSYSTEFRRPGGRLFDGLREQAVELLDLFSGRDTVALIPFASRPEPPLENPERMREQLREMTPSEETTDIEGALQAAAELLVGRAEWNREILLLTDMTAFNWADVDRRDATWLPGVSVYVSDPQVDDRPNVYVDDLRVDGWMQSSGRKLPLVVSLTNSSAHHAAAAVSVDLYLDGERRQHRQVDLAPRGIVHLEFTVAPRDPGRLTGYVEIDDDGLALDNRRYFALTVPQSLRVLLIGQEETDTYFARRAFSAGAAADPVLQVRHGAVGDLGSEGIAGVDVLVLCNVERLSAEQTRQVHGFAAAGGGVVIFPSPRADLSYFNRHLLPGLMAATIKDRVGLPGSASQQFSRLDPSRSYHGIFDGLLTADPEDQPRFWASFEIAAGRDLQTLIAFEDGRPAVVQGWIEAGRAVLFASPLDLEWNDLPLRGLFVPLMHRLSRYLSLPVDQNRAYAVGNTVRRYVESASADRRVQAESPSGRRLYIEADLVGGRSVWRIPRVDESGLWRLLQDGEPVDWFPVNIDTRESELAPLAPGVLDRVFGPGRAIPIRPGDDLRETVLLNRYGRELWKECLILAVVLLLLELWLSRAPARLETA